MKSQIYHACEENGKISEKGYVYFQLKQQLQLAYEEEQRGVFSEWQERSKNYIVWQPNWRTNVGEIIR